MVLNEEKQARLADALARRQGALGAASAFAPPAPISAAAAHSPAPSAPIAAVPLAAIHASPTPTPLRKAKGWWRLSLTRTPLKGMSSKGVERWWP